MESTASGCFPRYSWLDFLFAVVGVCTFLFDIGSDVWLAKEFYQHGEFFWFAALLGFMLVSSAVVQMFSWFWIQYDSQLDNYDFQTAGRRVVLFGSPKRVKLTCFLHICQLGFLLRHISAIWLGFCVWWRGEKGSEYAVYLTHDLSMLRLIETFCESAPQLSLMIYIMLHNNEARTIQYVSMIASTTSIAWMVVDYHRSLRSFLPDKSKQGWLSSAFYFLWNLLLIAPRVVTVALFTSVLPRYIAAHFLCLWLAFVLWAWLQDTNFMDTPAGEWLYRATIGLIWYFSWFNVAEGKTRGRSIIYHFFALTDIGVLLFSWWWLRDPETTQSYSLFILFLVPLSYVLGLLVKTLYYCSCHPTLWQPVGSRKVPGDTPDGAVALVQADSSAPEVVNKRMAKHVSNFYSTRTLPKTETNG
ncbi:XK-related protein 8.3 [Pygocentrus nattereri]|uniref:XK-related protein n=1 Tax=Pygocentrus nattereri TaxID=42514 RepID=A0A3B4E0B0_PYGNA|nr:XK-related protein 8.3 [Pygocentrus nattereri]